MTQKDKPPIDEEKHIEEIHSGISDQLINLFKNLRVLLRDRLSLKDLSEPEHTIEGIKKDIEFKGFNLWILIFSIIICSIGLNTNSSAVIIGAMLISPLMGPIMGMGLAVGTNDSETLKKSIKSLITAVIVAVLTSFIFFFFVPLGSEHSELFARTRPDIRDVFIAIFGGLTGILAGSRKEKTNVIPGVAIATALMPPLCTAGYGLASGHFEYFFGAFYLYLINSFFIALSTVLVVRYLKFPVATFLSKEKEKRGKRIIIFATLLVIIPSIWVFVKVIQDSVFERKANEFVSERISYKGTIIRNKDIVLEFTDTARIIQIFPLGEQIPQKVIDNWQRQLDLELKSTKLEIIQNGEEALALRDELSGRIELIEGANRTIYQKDQEILTLEKKVNELSEHTLPKSLGSELLHFDPLLNKTDFGMVSSQSYGGSKNDYILVSLYWSNDSLLQDSTRINRIYDFLKVRLEEDSVRLVNF